MIRTQRQIVLNWLRRVITEPRGELDRWQRAVRFAYDLAIHGAKQLRHDRAPQMAAALAFRTLFGLLPVLVVGTVLYRALQGPEGVQQLVRSIADSLSLNEYEIITRAGERSITASDWLVDLAGQASGLNLAAIGWIGLAIVIYSAISLMVTIEKSFGLIYRAPEGRRWVNRFLLYWTVLTLGPAAIALSFYVDARFDEWIAAVSAGGWVLKIATLLWSFLAIWLVMFAVYRLVPNTTVSAKPALIGAFVAAVLLEIGKRSLDAYFDNAISIQHLYGSLGLIPLFMFWVYIMWLVVLFGLEVSAILQVLRGRTLEEFDRKAPATGLVDPAAIFGVMQAVAEGFIEGRPVTSRDVSEAARVHEPVVRMMLERLCERGLVHRLDREDETYSPARPPDAIGADELLRIGFEIADDGSAVEGGGMVARFRSAQMRLATGLTLAGLAAAGLGSERSADQVGSA